MCGVVWQESWRHVYDGRGDLWTVLIAGRALADVRYESWRFGWLARGLSLCVFWLLDGGGVIESPFGTPALWGGVLLFACLECCCLDIWIVAVWVVGLSFLLLFRVEWE